MREREREREKLIQVYEREREREGERERMKATCMKTVDLVTRTARPLFFFHCSSSISGSGRAFLCTNTKHKKKLPSSLSYSTHLFSPTCSLPERLNDGEAVKEVSPARLLNVVLVSPQIPGNTGSIARSCAASGVGLHLVEPLGFQVDDTKLKRAGLDYWPYVVVKQHSSWVGFRDYFRQQDGEKRLLAFTKKGTNIHSEFSYRRGDWLVFGSETCGLPPEALLDCKSESLGGGTIRIPMIETYVRCLNLAVSVGIALYEASRQLNYEQFHCPSEPSIRSDGQESFTEDLFA